MELERLHTLQDKPFTEAKKAMFVQELCTGEYPFGAVIQGIKSFHKEDMRTVKIVTLIEGISKFIDNNYNRINCEHCAYEGAVIMIDEGGAQFALACKCSNGDIIAATQHLTRWNGKDIQNSKDRILYKTYTARAIAKTEPVVPVEEDKELAAMVASVGGTVVDRGIEQ